MQARLTSLLGLFCAVAMPLRADITMSIDILDAADPGGPAPTGLVVVDIGVDVSDDDWLFSAGIVGSTFHGAGLVYAETGDPNSPVTFLPPGLHNRFVSFGSAAYERNDESRFEPAGTVAEQTIALAGRYIGGPVPVLQTDRVNVGFWASPVPHSSDAPDAPRGRDGFVIRLAFDLAGVSIPGAGDAANYRIFPPGQAPTGYSPVFISDWEGREPGTFVGSWFDDTSGRDWGLYVPEPASASLLISVALAHLCTRRSTPHALHPR